MENVRNDSEIKKRALSGIIWKFLERFAAQGVSLVVSIILARLLSPSDYSPVAVVMIFFTFSNVLISGGLNTALMQKKDVDSEDFSTVLITSFFFSLLIYILLFLLAPLIAYGFHDNNLILIVRIMGISLPLNAVKSVWCAYISRNLQFKKFFFSTIIGTILSAVVGIFMAFKGCGVWSLVVQQLVNIFVDTTILIITTRIGIGFKTNFVKFKQLFGYGWKILVSSLLNATYNEITPFVVGLRFSSESLSFYTKGKSFPSTINTVSTNTISSVLFPFLSKYQDNNKKLLEYTRKYMKFASMIVFPMMLGLFSIADNFVYVLLTEKWIGAVVYIRIFCVSCMFDIIAVGNCETIKAIGKSGTFLCMEIIKKSSYFITIGIFIFFSKNPIMLACSSLCCALIQIIVNSIPNGKLIGYKIRYQICDLLPALIASAIMCVCVLLIGEDGNHNWLILLKQIIVGVCFYGLFIYAFESKTIKSLFKKEFIK